MKLKYIPFVLALVALMGCSAAEGPSIPDERLEQAHRRANQAIKRAENRGATEFGSVTNLQKARDTLDKAIKIHSKFPSTKALEQYRKAERLAYEALVRTLILKYREIKDKLKSDTKAKTKRKKKKDQLDQLLNEIQKVNKRIDKLSNNRAVTSRNGPVNQSMFEQQKSIKDKLAEKLNSGVVFIRGDKVIIRLNNQALFGSGDTFVRPASRPVLSKIGEFFKSVPDRPVEIHGHTDDIPLHPDHHLASNWELSAHRAVNVLKYFAYGLNIDRSRLSAVAHGAYSPLVPNTTPENRARNRRLEIVILPPKN
ncbi:MAG: OmpA family protein [bacterium]